MILYTSLLALSKIQHLKDSNFLLSQRKIKEEVFSVIRKSGRTGGRPFHKGGGSHTEKRKSFFLHYDSSTFLFHVK
jgi:hypothetical protein